MTHVCGRASSDKEKILNVVNKPLKSTDKKHCSANRFIADCKCSNRRSKTDGQHKIKQLRSRKERSHMRGGGKEALKPRSHHYHHHRHRQSGTDMAHFQSSCHRSCHCPPRREAPFPSVVPAAQEPSVITDSRLIGHHGLFNHEVKSIDIERLLSEQRKLENSRQQAQENNNSGSHQSSTSHVPSLSSTNDLLGAADTDEVLPFEKEAAGDDCQKKQEKISQGSDITPGQRSQQQLSSESLKSVFSSKHSSLDVVIVESKKTNPAVCEKGRESQLTPSVVRENAKTLNKKLKGHVISTLEHTPKKQETPIRQTQAPDLSPIPLELSSSHTAASFDMQRRRQDPDCVSRSVSSVAAGLCACLQFPFLRRGNLVAESREVLLKALRERHGSRLQENLLEVRRGLSCGADPAKKVQNQQPTTKDELLPPDAFMTAFQAHTASEPCFDTKETTSSRYTGSLPFNWTSRPQPHENLEQTAEWLTSPVETSVSILDDILLRPNCTPEFCMDFEPRRVSASDHLLWGEKASAWQRWEDGFNKPKSKEALFDSFENTFMKHSRAVPERSSRSRYSGSNTQRLFPYQGKPDRRSTEPMCFPQEEDPFETDRHSFAPSFSAQIHHPQQSFQPFGQFSHSSTCPPLQSHHTDMMRYPPSHMLDRDPAAPRSSFPSPERWAFPPMRLY